MIMQFDIASGEELETIVGTGPTGTALPEVMPRLMEVVEERPATQHVPGSLPPDVALLPVESFLLSQR